MSCVITKFMMKMSELVVLGKLQPGDFTKDFCTQQGISSHSADHCKELLQMWASRQEGRFCKKLLYKFLISWNNEIIIFSAVFLIISMLDME